MEKSSESATEGPLSFTLGVEQGDHLLVRVLRRAYPQSTDFWDGNWLAVEVEVACGAFRGAVRALLRNVELERFRAQVATLYETLSGEAKFETMDHWLSLSATGDGMGHVEVRGALLDDGSGLKNELSFRLHLDQTWLPRILRDLDAILTAYPVVARP